jgi:glycerophosphoryl diester phosphodiesterase
VISSKLPQFLIFGHRGSPRRFPENTIASFEDALASGADGFETDLRLLRDDTSVLFHDDDVVETLTAAECPDLARVDELAQFAGRTTMILEVKRRGWEEQLAQIVHDWPQIIIASFDHHVLANVRKHHASVALGVTITGAMVNFADYAASLGATWCFPNYHYVDAEMVASLHGRDIRVVPYTPNQTREWEALRAAGCDGVITDLAAEAVAWRANR